MGSHGATDLSPITMGAALHFGSAISNVAIQEHMPHSKETLEVFPHGYTFADGYMHPSDTPGHGVDFDEALASNISVRASLPPGQSEDRWDAVGLVALSSPARRDRRGDPNGSPLFVDTSVRADTSA